MEAHNYKPEVRARFTEISLFVKKLNNSSDDKIWNDRRTILVSQGYQGSTFLGAYRGLTIFFFSGIFLFFGNNVIIVIVQG